MPMKLIVTGASGFVGRGLLPALAAAGHQGIATGRTVSQEAPAGWAWRLRDEILADSHGGMGIDAIVHLEVKQHVPRPTAREIADLERVNVEGTRAWLQWGAGHGISRFVYLSSIKAVGGGPGVHLESDSTLPETPYGRSKAAAEAAVREWSEASHGRVATILRPAPVYGPGNEANLAAFVRQILRGRPCLVGAGASRKSIVARRNLTAAIAFAVNRETPGCEVYNVTDAEIVSVRALATLVAELGGCPAPRAIPSTVASVIAPLGDGLEMLTGREFPLTTSRLRALREETIFPCDKLVAAGFRHPCSLREGLIEMLEWAKAQ